MSKCSHLSDTRPAKFVLRRTDNGDYFPLTIYHCRKCGEEFVSDGIWWVMQGVPPNVIFEPEPDEDEIIIDIGFGKIRAVRQLSVFQN